MILISSGFLCIVVLLVLHCPVRSDENKVTTINKELREDKNIFIQDEAKNGLKGDVREKPPNRNSIAVRVVNGTKTGKKAHPYLAFIGKKNGVLLCGGSIISSEFILTAAHCLANATTGQIYPVKDRAVFLGLHNLLTWRNMQEFEIMEVIVHENFTKTGFDGFLHHDIGLVKLSHRIPHYHDLIQRICLAENDKKVYYSLTIGTIQGWGLIESTYEILPPHVRKTTLTILRGDACSLLYPEILPDHDSVVCGMDFKQTASPCRGDSGGPFFIKRNGGIKVQIGIVSYGLYKCSTKNSPAIFTRVSHFLPWILSHVPRSAICEMTI